MSYLGSGDGGAISPEVLELLADLVRMPLPADDVDLLAAALRNQLASIDAIDRLDLEGVQPALHFDPRWND